MINEANTSTIGTVRGCLGVLGANVPGFAGGRVDFRIDTDHQRSSISLDIIKAHKPSGNYLMEVDINPRSSQNNIEFYKCTVDDDILLAFTHSRVDLPQDTSTVTHRELIWLCADALLVDLAGDSDRQLGDHKLTPEERRETMQDLHAIREAAANSHSVSTPECNLRLLSRKDMRAEADADAN